MINHKYCIVGHIFVVACSLPLCKAKLAYALGRMASMVPLAK